MTKKIAFQGVLGAYSHMACLSERSDYEPMPCKYFEDAFNVLRNKEADLAMIPIENSTAGRVADIHHLLPKSGLKIVGEYFQPIQHQLLGVKGATLGDVKVARSHVQALSQTKDTLRQLGIERRGYADTAGAAEYVANTGDVTVAAVASSLAGEIYGLDVLKENISDQAGNTTRFIVLSRDEITPDPDTPSITTFVFTARSVPSALYKALGGFATNKVNITKLESYVGKGFSVAQFYMDVAGHIESQAVQNAMSELGFFADVEIMGCYSASSFRNL